jgi:hypothetical protein
MDRETGTHAERSQAYVSDDHCVVADAGGAPGAGRRIDPKLPPLILRCGHGGEFCDQDIPRRQTLNIPMHTYNDRE